jgi:hypothetical protein
MTPFQETCTARLEALLKNLNVGFSKEVVPRADRVLGEKPGDVYVRYECKLGAKDFEVYVYIDEVGYAIGKDWVLFEVPDYRDPEQRIATFEKSLRDDMKDGPEGRKRRTSWWRRWRGPRG